MEAPSVSFLVLRSPDIDRLRTFYETIGLQFKEEKHDEGPMHYSCDLGQVTLELYPTKGNADSVSIGLTYSSLETVLLDFEPKCIEKQPFISNNTRTAWLRDPDGRLVQLFERSGKN